jgi:hypothetical protein
MALQFNYNDPSTLIVAPTCYAKILSILIDVIPQIIDVRVGLFYMKAASDGGQRPFAEYHGYPPFAVIMGGPINIPVASYNYMKTLPLFALAVDV